MLTRNDLSDRTRAAISFLRSWTGLSLFTFFALVAWLAFFVVPLTYDEVWNWALYASNGIRVACCQYEPNNHILYSMISGFINRHRMVNYWPLTMRLPNLLVVAAFTLFLMRCVFLHRRQQVLLAAAVLGSSGLTLRYVIVGRGYLLGTFLVFCGAYLLSRKSRWTWAALTLAAYSVPTFILHWPGLFLVGVVRGPLHTVLTFGLAAISTFLLYRPVIDKMRTFSAGMQLLPKLNFLTESTASSLQLPSRVAIALVLVGVVSAAVYLVRHWRDWRASAQPALAAFLFAGFVSYLILSSFVVNLFQRNGIALGALFVASMILFATASDVRWVSRLTMGLVAVNLAFGMYAFSTSAARGFTNDAAFILLTPTPIEHYWSQIVRSVEVIDCRGNVATTCSAFDAALRRHGVVRDSVESTTSLCAFGSRLFPEGSGSSIYVRTKYGRTGQLCFP